MAAGAALTGRSRCAGARHPPQSLVGGYDLGESEGHHRECGPLEVFCACASWSMMPSATGGIISPNPLAWSNRFGWSLAS